MQRVMDRQVTGQGRALRGLGRLAIAAAIVAPLAACDGLSARQQRAVTGGAIGAAGGAAIGAITGGSVVTGAVLGGAGGAAVGALTGPSRR